MRIVIGSPRPRRASLGPRAGGTRRGSGRPSAWLVAPFALLLAACSGTTAGTASPASVAPSVAPTPAPAPVELTFLSQVTPTATEEFWNGLLADFMASHPGITVKQIPGPTDLQPFVAQLLATGNVPDVGFAIGVTKDTTEHLATWDLADPDLAVIKNTQAQTVGGKLYSLGTDIQARDTIYYDKDLFAKAGVTQLPTTWDGLAQVCAQLKAADIVPFLAAGEWVTGRMFMGLNDIYIKTPDWNIQRAAGKVHFTDPEWLAAAQRWQQWNKDGCFNKGALGIGYTQVGADFLAGKGAMYQMGTWFTGDEKAAPASFKIGVFAPPSSFGDTRLNGGIGSLSFSVFKATKHEAEARILAKWLALDQGPSVKLMDQNGYFSGLDYGEGKNPKRDFTPLQEDTQALISSSTFTIDYIGQGDLTPKWAGYTDAINTLSQNLLLGKDAAAELAALDKLWDENSK